MPGPKPQVVSGKAFQSSLIERENLSFQNLKSEPMVSVMVRMRKKSFGEISAMTVIRIERLLLCFPESHKPL